MKLILMTVMLVCLSSSCKIKLPFSQGTSKQTNAKEDDGRPSEVGEGLPGYLTDPSAVAVNRSGNKVNINAKAGTAKPENQSTGRVQIIIMQVDRQNLASTQNGNSSPVLLGNILMVILSENDGSFSVSIDVQTDDPIVIRTTGKSTDNTISIVDQKPDRTTLAYKDLLNEEQVKPLDNALLKKVAAASPNQTPAVTDVKDDSGTSQTQTTRDAALWPFDANDPWNLALGSSAVFEDISSSTASANGGASLNSTEYTHPVYIAQASDPLTTFKRSDGTQCAQIRAPADAKPDPQSNGHLHVIDEKHENVVENWHATRNSDGSFTSTACVVNPLKGPGVYAEWHGARAYGGSAIAGLIRKGEISKGIPHALAIATNLAGLNRNAPGGKCYVWPASSCDSAGALYGTSGNLYMGSLLGIPPTVDLASLGLTAAGMVVGKALQDYGAYLVDTGWGNIIFYTEPSASGEIPGGLTGDLNKLVSQLKVVTNNKPASI
ncbi:MAG: hypothetical protein HQK54_16765, partial [Oligoflexales bacterium]|nr:hypothetical protein [Oligoflexales bacterium]